MSGYKLYTLEKIAQHMTRWKFQWPILLPGVKDLSKKALKGGPYSLTIAKCLGKPFQGQGSFSRIIIKYTNLKEKALI